MEGREFRLDVEHSTYIDRCELERVFIALKGLPYRPGLFRGYRSRSRWGIQPTAQTIPLSDVVLYENCNLRILWSANFSQAPRTALPGSDFKWTDSLLENVSANLQVFGHFDAHEVDVALDILGFP